MSYNVKINEITNQYEQEIKYLFDNLGFDFVAKNAELWKGNEKIGEIDLLYTFGRFLFLIEVSSVGDDRTQKKLLFFSKWENSDFLEPIKNAFELSGKKIVKIYLDYSKNSYTEESEVVINSLKGKELDLIGYKEDIDYFLNSVNKIGQWARNDFLDWTGIEDNLQYKDTPAIQYYIQNLPVYCFVESIDVLLNSCYISRRRRNSPDLGYQRTLDKKRILNIQKSVQTDKEGLKFPNSILIHSPKLSETIYPKEECPKIVTIKFPIHFCSCKVIDGQHRLLGFAKLDPKKLDQYFLTVIALPEIENKQEFKTFIDINSNHQKMDNNLILRLKSDFEWSEGTRERFDQIGVHVADRLNGKILKNRIFSGTADESKGDKITLVTFVNALKNNRQILPTEDETFKKVSKIFANIGESMPEQIKTGGFFNQNKGIRILFRLVQLFERNQKAGKISVSQKDFFMDLNQVLDKNTIQELGEYYGGGGATSASKHIIEMIKEMIPQKYDRMQIDLKGI